jgi:hypothetical protein
MTAKPRGSAAAAAPRSGGSAPAPPPASAAVLARSAAGVPRVFLGLVAQRLLTFALNAALLRLVSRDVVGFAASDMELLLSTVLFLSREAARLVALRARWDDAAEGAEGVGAPGEESSHGSEGDVPASTDASAAGASGRAGATALRERRAASRARGPSEPAAAVVTAAPPKRARVAVTPSRQRLVNLAWVPVPLGLALVAAALALHAARSSGSTAAAAAATLPGEAAAFRLFCLAAALEVLAEPFYILSTAALA